MDWGVPCWHCWAGCRCFDRIASSLPLDLGSNTTKWFGDQSFGSTLKPFVRDHNHDGAPDCFWWRSSRCSRKKTSMQVICDIETTINRIHTHHFFPDYCCCCCQVKHAHVGSIIFWLHDVIFKGISQGMFRPRPTVMYISSDEICSGMVTSRNVVVVQIQCLVLKKFCYYPYSQCLMEGLTSVGDKWHTSRKAISICICWMQPSDWILQESVV